jgi:hypothetical protein
MRGKIVAIAAAAAAVAGGGAAVAATGLGTPQEESKAVVADAAKQLGVDSAKLSAALKQALANRVDAAVAAGRLTKAQGDELKARIKAEDYPVLGFGGRGHHDGRGHGGGPGFGHGHGFGHLGAAATYLGVTAAELRTQLDAGKTLADVAKAQGKTVDGLVTALLADEKKELDAAVAAGRLTQAQGTEILAGAKQRFTDMANGVRPAGGRHGFGGPPPPAAPPSSSSGASFSVA